jgi:hypothetical protein
VRGLREEIVHNLEGPPETLYSGEGAKTPGERALLRVGDVQVVLGVELAHNRE